MNYTIEIAGHKIEADYIGDLVSQLTVLTRDLDLMELIHQIQEEVQALDPETTIVIEEDENQRVLSHMEFANEAHPDSHRITYRKDHGTWQHAVINSLMHLEMHILAKKAGRNVSFKKEKDNEIYFFNTFGTAFARLIPRVGLDNARQFFYSVLNGLAAHVMNCPLDLFAEQRVFARYKDAAMIQLLALLNQEIANIAHLLDNPNTPLPPKIVSIERVYCMISSQLLKEFYGLDLLPLYNAPKKDIALAKDLFEEYQAYIADYHDGDEFDLYDYFAETMDIDKILKKVEEN